MKKEIATKWTEALRSGQYKQGTKTLQDNNCFCCLGVLARLAEDDGVDVKLHPSGKIIGDSLVMQTRVMEWSGLKTNMGRMCDDESLADMNDEGSTFLELADVIDENWEGL